MKCPICKDMQLIMSDRHGIEIDYCPNCRGVWLDRGELDKLIERSIPHLPPEPHPSVRPQASASRGLRPLSYQDPRYGYIKEGYGQKQRKNLLAELFDF
ncbi:hypothetical protein GCM10007205_02010 [Oxalicibacterium flavum]|uniref:Transcription factor zinc-finger domain-containing protein n=1 Tax=Oxalicibacterium flavum TaxID=179467 RepID=A0A8J2UN83_9BURK|nr:zf-TFIIB domain-containing protein [Oxalicibacterium flavum]GGB96331.1 hypothetical protein GCM10007205_02010 [Oxalicibacterium flavum]